MMKIFNGGRGSKGQAALEFLTTYGWAFLVILVMIAALGYFGVLDPQNFLPERCNVAAEFQCDDYLLDWNASDEIDASLYFVNQAGTTVTIKDFEVVQTAEINNQSCMSSTITVGASNAFEVTCDDIAPPTGGSFAAEGDKQRVGFILTYRKAGGRYDHEVSGELFATLQ